MQPKAEWKIIQTACNGVAERVSRENVLDTLHWCTHCKYKNLCNMGKKKKINTPNLDQKRQLKGSQNIALFYKLFWHFSMIKTRKSNPWEFRQLRDTWKKSTKRKKKEKKEDIKIINQRPFSFTPGVKTLLLDAINLGDLTGFNGKSLILCSKKQRFFPLDTMTSSIPLWSSFTSYAESSTAQFITSVQSCLQLTGPQLCFTPGTEFLEENEAPSFHSEIATAALKNAGSL